MDVARYRSLCRLPQAYVPDPSTLKVAEIAVALQDGRHSEALREAASLLSTTKFPKDVRDGILCKALPKKGGYALFCDGEHLEGWMMKQGASDWADLETLSIHLLTSARFGAAAWTHVLSSEDERAVLSLDYEVKVFNPDRYTEDRLSMYDSMRCGDIMRQAVERATSRMFKIASKKEEDRISNNLSYEKVFTDAVMAAHTKNDGDLTPELVALVRRYHEEELKRVQLYMRSHPRRKMASYQYRLEHHMEPRGCVDRSYVESHNFRVLHEGLSGVLEKMQESVNSFNASVEHSAGHKGAKLSKGLRFDLGLRGGSEDQAAGSLDLGDGGGPLTLKGRYRMEMRLPGEGSRLRVCSKGECLLSVGASGVAQAPPMSGEVMRTFREDLPGLLRLMDHMQKGNMGDVAKKLGGITGNCMFCSKRLTDAKSIRAGVGPVCMKAYGSSFDSIVTQEVRVYRVADVVAELRDPEIVVRDILRSSESLVKYVMENTENGRVIMELASGSGEEADEKLELSDEELMHWARRMCEGDRVGSFDRAFEDYVKCISAEGEWLPADGVSMDRMMDLSVMCVRFYHQTVDGALRRYFSECFGRKRVLGSIDGRSVLELARSEIVIADAEDDHACDKTLAKRKAETASARGESSRCGKRKKM
jgi:Family of unknown function (DUF6011)